MSFLSLTRSSAFHFFTLASLIVFQLIPSAHAQQNSFYKSSRVSPRDYLLGSHGKDSDSIFDSTAIVELNVDLGLTSDCGKLDFTSTLQSTLNNVLNEKYLEGLGRNIIGSSPMLLTCYFSPTWCAILKHSRISANFLASMRQNQCGMINKFIDTRAQDFYEQRQRCINNSIAQNGGDLESAMDSCQDYTTAPMKSWAGGSDTSENRLIESTAQWAKLSDPESKKTVDLVKALVGDTVVANGSVSVDFGQQGRQSTPRIYLASLQTSVYTKLCQQVLTRASTNSPNSTNFGIVISNQDLKQLSGDNDSFIIDRQTIRLLAFMPKRKRDLACKKLADSMALTIFTNDMGKSLDFLSSKVGANPNIPENRKLEAERKRQALKDQIEVTLSLYKNRSEPLNQVLYQINEEGQRFEQEIGNSGIEIDRAQKQHERTKAQLFDCADGVLCQ